MLESKRRGGLWQPLLLSISLIVLIQCSQVFAARASQSLALARSFETNRAGGHVAIAVYAPESYARSLKCEALVESIRSQGQWTGQLYFITQELPCYQHDRWVQCGLDAEMVVLKDNKAAEQASKRSRNASLRWWRMLGPAWDEYRARLVRSHLWQLLQPPDTVEAVLYFHGCQALVGSPLMPLLQSAVEQLRKPDGPMLVVAPTMPATGSLLSTHQDLGAKDSRLNRAVTNAVLPVGAGDVWVVHRRASEKLLEAWRDEVLNSPTPHMDDDSLLLSAVQKAAGTSCSGAQALDCLGRSVLQWDSFARTVQCDSQLGCGFGKETAVLNYLPKDICTRVRHDMLADWVHDLDLCVYQDLGYCTPPIMRLFENSWLPYPKCAKLELGLSRFSCQWTCTEPTVMRSPRYRTVVTQRDLVLSA